MEPPPLEPRDEPRETLKPPPPPPVPPDREEISENQILAKEEVGGKCKLEKMDKNMSFKDIPGWGYDGRRTFGKHRDKPDESKAREQGNK
ncbi:hypothetical protein R3W88_029459 [Solanum pinnatisectum]|uniref:Uncharacterized protein n=1 Tax=Solanum pinnatisectum TaxID=50273 RepID=A0AAV9K5M6_9SOLN|nr:hypothetical protein R3W88_029459 [Solanum pinnatisectum]